MSSIKKTWEPASRLLPLSLLQKQVLKKTLEESEEHELCYKDINSIFKKLDTQISSKKELYDFIVKGGNAFFNHFVFCLMHMGDWSVEAERVFHVHDIALKMNSFLSQQVYRYVWFKVETAYPSKVKQIKQIKRGSGWFVCPKQAKSDGMDHIHPGVMSWRGERYLLMIESTCSCLLFLDDENRFASEDIACKCVNYNFILATAPSAKIIHANSVSDSEEEGYDTVDQNSQILEKKMSDCASEEIREASLSKDSGMEIQGLDQEEEDQEGPEECGFCRTSFEDEVCYIDGVRVSRCCCIDFKSDTPYSFRVGTNVNLSFQSDTRDIKQAYQKFLESN